MPTPKSEEGLQQSLQQVKALLDRHRVLESLTHRQEGPKRDLLETMVHRQNLAELGARGCGAIHPADLAYVAGGVARPRSASLTWEQLDLRRRAGAVLVELPRRGAGGPAAEDAARAPPRGRAAAHGWTRTTSRTSRSPLASPRCATSSTASLDADGSLLGRRRPSRIPTARWGELMTPVTRGDRARQPGRSAPHPDALRRGAARCRSAPTRRSFTWSTRATSCAVRSRCATCCCCGTDELGVGGDLTLGGRRVVPPGRAGRGDAAKASSARPLLAAPVVDERGKVLGRLTVETVLDFLRQGVGDGEL